jgi:general secretion pathway protein L
MMLWHTLIDLYWHWIDSVSRTIDQLFERFGSRRAIRLIEGEDDTVSFELGPAVAERSNVGWLRAQRKRQSATAAKLPEYRVRIVDGKAMEPPPHEWAAALRGGRVELVLRPERFLFRPLELPRRALDFLDGIVRAQIDRMTPWHANEAVFGWTPPIATTDNHIRLTIVATARSTVKHHLAELSRLGASLVTVSTSLSDGEPDAAPIVVLRQSFRGSEGLRTRRILAASMVAAGLAAVSSTAICSIAADRLDSARQELSRKIAMRRVAMRLGTDSFGNPAQRLLEQRKQTAPSSVIVLEALSQILPDNTYVTELRVERDKLQVVGISRDAPLLIQLIERSPHFTHATFFAPTTQTPGDPGERFHIEAHIQPDFSLGL